MLGIGLGPCMAIDVLLTSLFRCRPLFTVFPFLRSKGKLYISSLL
jgi:hypothetical protein